MITGSELIESAEQRIEKSNRLLCSPDRLNALKRTGLMGTPGEEAFDRLAYLAAQILDSPLTIISLVSEDKQFFKAAYGLPQPFDVTREIPIAGSICRYTLHGEPIIASDASADSLLSAHPSTAPWGIKAFIALPLITEEGHVLGAFCAVDYKAREWSARDILVMKELTASVMTEIKLRVQVAELHQERQIRERLVLALMHDLRTPLTSAKMSAQLINKKVESRVDVIQLSDRISRTMDRADLMIQDLLDASRIKKGGEIPVFVEKFRLDELVLATILELQEVHGPRFEFRNEIGPVLGRWDRSGLRRVIENLVGNAIKYGELNSIITLGLIVNRDGIDLFVHNRGNEIPIEDQKVLFDPYSRTTSAVASGQKGWGIGLTLVRGIVEAHGGTIRVVSEPGKGTTFFVHLHYLNQA